MNKLPSKMLLKVQTMLRKIMNVAFAKTEILVKLRRIIFVEHRNE